MWVSIRTVVAAIPDARRRKAGSPIGDTHSNLRPASAETKTPDRRARRETLSGVL